MHRCVVYTSITGGYDSLKPVPPRWSAQADFVAYVDRPLAANGWNLRPAARAHVDPCRNAKVHKIVPEDLFATYDYSVWVDGSVGITSATSLPGMLENLLATADFAVFRHRSRGCIYEEAEACIRAAKDDPELIRQQVTRYRAEGYPERNGLCECTVLVRRHTPAVVDFCRRWHGEIAAGSRRDQLSFNYVARRCGLEPGEASAELGQLALLGMVERIDGGWRPTRLGRGRPRTA